MKIIFVFLIKYQLFLQNLFKTVQFCFIFLIQNKKIILIFFFYYPSFEAENKYFPLGENSTQ